MKEDRRIDYFDTAKGVLIILVILGHVLAYEEAYLKSVIYSFHMPAFFLISGILATKGSSLRKPFAEYILLKARLILVPYVVFEAISQLVENARGGFWMNFNGYVFTVVSACLKNNCANWVNWFLVALFFGELMLYFFQRIRLRYLRLMLLFGVGAVAPIIPYDAVRPTVFAFAFLALGVLIGEMKEKKQAPISVVVLLGALNLLVSGLNGRISIGEGNVNNPLLFYIGSVAGSFWILRVSKLWLQKFTFLNYCGRNSLYIMGLHVPVIRLCGSIYASLENPVLRSIVGFALVSAIVITIVWMINRMKAAMFCWKNEFFIMR